MVYPESYMHNVNTSSPGYQMVQDFRSSTDQARADAYAQMYARLQQQQAQQAQAQAQALALQAQMQQAQASGVGPYSFVPAPAPQGAVVEPEAPGFWGQVTGRALPETLGTFQGAGAALSDLVGFEAGRDYLLERAQANFAQAQENAPRQVGRIEDIDSLDSLGTWAAETAADLLPSIVGTMATGGIGGVAAVGVTGAKTAATGVIKNAVQKTAQDYIKKGMTKELAEQTAKNKIKNDIRTKGIQSGVFGFTAAQGTGSAYNENVQNQGVDNASALRALGVGGVQGLITSLMGMETSLLKSLTGVAVSEAKEQGFKRMLATGIARGAFQEGGEETLQELTQTLNRQYSDGRFGKFNSDDLSGLVNSMAAGMLFGGPGGAVNSYMQRSNAQKNQEAPTVETEPSPITTPEQRRNSSFNRIREAQAKAEGEVLAQYENERNNIMAAINKTRDTMTKYGNSSKDPKIITMATSARSKILNKAGKDYANLMASLTRVENNLESEMEKAVTSANNQLKKTEAEYISDATIAQSNQFWSDPEAFTQLSSAGQDAIRHVARQNSFMNTRVQELSNRIAQVRERLNSPEAMGDFRIAKAMKEQEAVLAKEMKEIKASQIALNNAGTKISNMLSKPDKSFTPQKLDAELAKVYSSVAPTTATWGSLADNGTFSAYDSARNIIQEDADARARQAEDALKYMQSRQAEMGQYGPQIDSPGSDLQLGLPGREALALPPSSTQMLPAGAQPQALPSGTQQALPSAGEQMALPPSQVQALPASGGSGIALPQYTESPIPLGQGYEDMLNQAEANLERQQHLAEQQGIQNTGIYPARAPYVTSEEAIAIADEGAVRPALPETTTTGTQGFNPAPETGLLLGTTNAATKVHTLIQPSLKQMQGLGRATVVVDSPAQVNLQGLPEGTLGAYDPQTNRVYLFAENIYAEAARNSKTGVPNSRDIKNVATRTLVHEGVVHYGFSILMSPAERKTFLHAVQNSFKDHPLYKQVRAEYAAQNYQSYKKGDTPLHIVEEFLARYAEQNTIANLVQGTKGKNYAPLMKRITDMFKKFLQKVGLVKVTNEDVMDVFKAASAQLAKNTTYSIKSSPLVQGGTVPVPSLGSSDMSTDFTDADISTLNDLGKTIVDKLTKRLPGLRNKVSVEQNLNVSGTDAHGLYSPGIKGVLFKMAGNIQIDPVSIARTAWVRPVNGKLSTLNTEVFTRDFEKVFVHEAIVHYGLGNIMSPAQRKVFFEKARPLLEKLYGPYELAQHNLAYKDSHIYAEELLADYATRYTVEELLSDTTHSGFKKILAYIKDFLNKMVSSKDTFSEADIVNVLKASAQRLANPSMFDGVFMSSQPYHGSHKSLRDMFNEFNPDSPSLPLRPQMGPNEQQATADLNAGAMPVVNQAKDFVTNPEARTSARDKFMEKFVDAIHPIRKMIDEVKGRDGGIVGMDSNLYKVMQNMPNKTAADIKGMHAQYVRPLLQYIAEITPTGQDVSITYARIADYATAKAALERNLTTGEDGVSGKGWTNAYAQSVIDNLASPQMDRALDLLQNIHEARLKRIEENVLLPKEQTDAWRAKYKWYMPLKAWDSILQNEAPQWYKGSLRTVVSQATRQDRIGASAKGNKDAELDNAVTHSILQLYDVVGFQHNVETGRSLLSLVEGNPDFTDLFEIEEIYVPDVDGDTTGIPRKRVVDNEGNLKMRKLKSSAQLHPNKSVVVIDPKGNKVRVIIHDAGVLTAFKGENVAQLNGPMQTIANIRRNLGMLFTVYNPTFWVRNPIRDTMTAVLNISGVADELQKYGIPNSSEMAKAIFQKGLMRMGAKSGVTRALYRAAMNGDVIDFSKLSKEDADYMKHYSAFVNYGAKSSYFSTGGYEKTNIDLVKELRDMKPSTKGQSAGAKMRALGAHMEAISDALENQTRYIAFVEVVNALKQAGMSEGQAYERAANIALNLTVNFSKKGAAAPVMDALWMFSSANIAGNARLLETIMRKDKTTGKYDLRYMSKFLTYPAVAYFAQSMLARAIMPEDEDGISMYDKIPDYVKANNIIIPTLDGAYITIPIAYGLNVFWNMGRNINDSIYATATGTKGPSFTEAATDIISAGFDNFSPMGSVTNEGLTAFVPTIFRPMIQLNTNQNFAGNPIYPDGTNIGGGEYPDSQKAWTSTGPVYKMLAEGINELFGGSTTRSSGFTDISPETIEHLMGAYLGGAGRLTGQMLNDVTKLIQGDYTGGDFMKLPGLSAFVRTQQPGDTSAVYYKARTELQTQINTVDEAKVNPSLSTQEKIEVIRNNQAGVRMKDELNRAQKQLNDLRSKERNVGSNTKLSEKTKRSQLEQLQNRRLAIMKRINKRALELGVRVN